MIWTVNAGVKYDGKTYFTLTNEDREIFFLTYNEISDSVVFNCFVDNDEKKERIIKILKSYLTNPNNVLYFD